MNTELIIPALISFFATLIITPYFIKKFKARGITGFDVHKPEKTEVAEMGGIPIFIGFLIGFVFVIYYFINNIIEFSAILSTVIIAALIGVIDDRTGIRQRIKAILPVFAAVPLMIIQAGHHTMLIPFAGPVDFGIFYPLILIPLGVTVVSNAFNLLAGYNGLESGLGFISCMFMGTASFITGNNIVAVFLFCLSGTLLAFLYYNKYPARIFPGDTGVFIVGSSIAAAAIMANLEVIGIILLIPFIINGIITTTDILRGKPIEKFAKVDENGYLKPPSRKYVYNLYYILANLGKTTEKQLVLEFWAIEFICGLMALSLLIF